MQVVIYAVTTKNETHYVRFHKLPTPTLTLPLMGRGQTREALTLDVCIT